MFKSFVSALVIAGAIVISGCSSTSAVDNQAADIYSDERDPWENANRAIFRFNETADRYVMKPVAKGYKFITPDPVETGVSNVFSNLGEPVNAFNNTLQGKFKQAGIDLSRLLINSTLGIGGVFDLAKTMGLEPGDGEDFGQTLATWGVPQGPYLVLPFMGPSTLRDGPAMLVDGQLGVIDEIDHVPTRNQVYGLRVLDIRSRLLDIEELMSGDAYTFMRDAYLDRRDYLINDGEVEDDFGF